MSSSPNRYLDPTNEMYAFSSDDEAGAYNRYTPGRDPRLRNKSSRRNSKLNRTPGSGNSRYNHAHTPNTVSLLDFERTYSPYSPKKQSTDQTNSILNKDNYDWKLPRGILGHLVRCKRWLEGTSRWRIALVGCVLGLLFAVIYQGGLHLGAFKQGECVAHVIDQLFVGDIQLCSNFSI